MHPHAMSSSPVLCSLDAHGVAQLTFNRPQVNNAYDGETLETLLTHLQQLAQDASCRMVVLSGAGKHFQAGADLQWIQRIANASAEENIHASRQTALAVHRLNHCPKPTVALVQGACFGGGTGIAAACDVVIAADNASFSIAETRWGLMAGIILPQLADAIGVRQLRRYAQTGERFDAHEAKRIGLVHSVVSIDALEAAGQRMVQALLANAPQANAQTKARILHSAWGQLSEAQLDTLIQEHARKRQSAEAREGLASFIEKRAAAWNPFR